MSQLRHPEPGAREHGAQSADRSGLSHNMALLYFSLYPATKIALDRPKGSVNVYLPFMSKVMYLWYL